MINHSNRLAVTFPLLLLMMTAAATQADDNKTGSAAGRHRPGGVVTRVVVMTGYEKAMAMTDAERARRRQAGMSRVESPRSPRFNARQSQYTESLDGRRNPELFFRHELFDEILWSLCPFNEHRDVAKRDWGSQLRSLGVDDSLFWEQLERSAGSYRSAHCIPKGGMPGGRTVAVRVKSIDGGGEVQLHVDLQRCRSRFAALEAAQKAIGKATLDKVLYAVVAPVTSMSFATSRDHRIDELVYFERGCQ